MHSAGGSSSFCPLFPGSGITEEAYLINHKLCEVLYAYIKIGKEEIPTVLDIYHQNMKVKPARLNVIVFISHQLILMRYGDQCCNMERFSMYMLQPEEFLRYLEASDRLYTWQRIFVTFWRVSWRLGEITQRFQTAFHVCRQPLNHPSYFH